MAREDSTYAYLNSSDSAYIGRSIDSASTNKILLDNISTHYLFEEELHMSFSILKKYENIILSNLVETDLSKDYWYKPEYLSYDYYGTTDLWYLIMFVNKLTDPIDFVMEKVYLVDIAFIPTFIEIISKETNMKNSISNYKLVYKHILKDLNTASKRVLTSDFNDSLDDLNDLKNYEDVTDEYLNKENFEETNSHLICGLLDTNCYYVTNNSNKTFYKNIKSSKFSGLDDYYDENLNLNKDNIDSIEITKEGYLKPYKSGYYKFKIYTKGNFSMIINNTNVIDFSAEESDLNSLYTKNIFEEYSLNSDFKRRNLDYWSTEYSLIYDEERNKNMLHCPIITNDASRKELFNIRIDSSKIKFDNEGDFVIDIDYYLPTGKRYHKLSLNVNIETKDNKTYSYDYQSTAYYYENSDKCKETIIIPKESNILNDNINYIELSVYAYTSYNYYGRTSEINISKVKIYNFKSSDYIIYLDKNKLYNLSTKYSKTFNESDFFLLEYNYCGIKVNSLPEVLTVTALPTVEKLDELLKFNNTTALPIVDTEESLFTVKAVDSLPSVINVKELPTVEKVSSLPDIKSVNNLPTIKIVDILDTVKKLDTLFDVEYKEELPSINVVSELPGAINVTILFEVISSKTLPVIETVSSLPNVNISNILPDIEIVEKLPEIKKVTSFPPSSPNSDILYIYNNECYRYNNNTETFEQIDGDESKGIYYNNKNFYKFNISSNTFVTDNKYSYIYLKENIKYHFNTETGIWEDYQNHVYNLNKTIYKDYNTKTKTWDKWTNSFKTAFLYNGIFYNLDSSTLKFEEWKNSSKLNIYNKKIYNLNISTLKFEEYDRVYYYDDKFYKYNVNIGAWKFWNEETFDDFYYYKNNFYTFDTNIGTWKVSSVHNPSYVYLINDKFYKYSSKLKNWELLSDYTSDIYSFEGNFYKYSLSQDKWTITYDLNDIYNLNSTLYSYSEKEKKFKLFNKIYYYSSDYYMFKDNLWKVINNLFYYDNIFYVYDIRILKWNNYYSLYTCNNKLYKYNNSWNVYNNLVYSLEDKGLYKYDISNKTWNIYKDIQVINNIFYEYDSNTLSWVTKEILSRLFLYDNKFYKYNSTKFLLEEYNKVYIYNNTFYIYDLENYVWKIADEYEQIYFYNNTSYLYNKTSKSWNVYLYYEYIPYGWFYIEQNESIQIDNNILLSIYNDETDELLNQMIVNELNFNEEKLSHFNLTSGTRYRFNFKISSNNSLNKVYNLVGDKNHRILLYTASNNFSSYNHRGTKNYQDLSSVIDLTKSNDKNIMIDVIINELTNVLSFQVFVKNSNVFDELDINELTYYFNNDLVYTLSKGIYNINKYLPYNYSLYKEICKKNLKDDWIINLVYKNSKKSMNGLHGIILDYKDNKSYYLVLFNFNNNPKYLLNGIYKINKTYDINKLCKDLQHKYFSENMLCLGNFELTDSSSSSTKQIKIIKRKGHIWISEDNSRYPFFRIEDKSNIYINGKIGFLNLQTDNVSVNMTLWN